MTQEDKQLLLKDLCARLPYGVKVESVFINTDTKKRKSCGIEVFDATCILMIRDGFGEFKPYLFPLSSMTEEQTKELINLINTGQNDNNEFMRSLCRIEFYHKYHFDYRGLIPMGLAIDATGLNIYWLVLS